MGSPDSSKLSMSPQSDSVGSDLEDGPVKLQRTIGVISAALVVFGNCVGAGIFISPKGMHLNQEPTEPSKQPIRAGHLGHVTGYQPLRDQYFMVRSVPASLINLRSMKICIHITTSLQCCLQSKYGNTKYSNMTQKLYDTRQKYMCSARTSTLISHACAFGQSVC